jgi:uncharacterized protein (DUF2062 family)
VARLGPGGAARLGSADAVRLGSGGRATARAGRPAIPYGPGVVPLRLPRIHLRRRPKELLRDLFARAKNEHSAPAEVGVAIGMGVFVGFTPFLGFHMWIALGIATMCRLNRLWAFLGSRASFLPLYVWVSFCEIQTGHRLRTGQWADLRPHEVLTHGKELFTDWLLGTGLIAGTLGVLAGLVAYMCACRWAKSPPPADPIGLTPRRPAGLPRPSSESRPSAPPDPSS